MGAMMERTEGWEGRLAAAIAARVALPYALGSNDCFRLACAAVEALTGRDLWPEWDGTYQTKRQALVHIARYGGDFTGAASKFFGSSPVSWMLAQRGDILEYQDADGEQHLGVCIGAAGAVFGESGMIAMPLDEFCHAWKIG